MCVNCNENRKGQAVGTKGVSLHVSMQTVRESGGSKFKLGLPVKVPMKVYLSKKLAIKYYISVC